MTDLPPIPDIATQRRGEAGVNRPVTPPAAKPPRQRVFEVVDPRHPQAEATAQGWGKGVVSLTETELVLEQDDLDTQVVDVTERRLILTPEGDLHIVWVEDAESLLED